MVGGRRRWEGKEKVRVRRKGSRVGEVRGERGGGRAGEGALESRGRV